MDVEEYWRQHTPQDNCDRGLPVCCVKARRGNESTRAPGTLPKHSSLTGFHGFVLDCLQLFLDLFLLSLLCLFLLLLLLLLVFVVVVAVMVDVEGVPSCTMLVPPYWYIEMLLHSNPI